MKLYGLKTCDICRKALKWLSARRQPVEFVDVREGPITKADIARFVAAAGWQVALNRKSTTWRGLDDADRADLDEANGAIIAGFDATAQARVSEILREN